MEDKMRDMLGRKDAVSVREAQRLIAGHIVVRAPSVCSMQIMQAYNMVAAEDIHSPECLPSFSRSTVDGFAVNSSDTFGASEGFPAYLNLQGQILMGEEPSFILETGFAAGVPTGGMLPKGSDAVVMLEHVQQIDGAMIEVLRPVAPRENVIQAGEDMDKGEVLLKKGARLRPQDIAALAGVAITSVSVYERPRVSVISTGDEIVSADSPVKAGQVRDVNSFNLAGLILEQGCQPVIRGIFKDIYEDIRDAVEKSTRDSAMVIITGGSSVGTKDMTAKVIDSIGSPGVLFHGVTLKPGKPTICGIVNGVPVFGLPGHPAAVTVCFSLFIEPVLRQMTGSIEKTYLNKKRIVSARLTRNFSSDAGREEHVRVSLEARGNEIWATPILGKSGLIRTLVMADGTFVIPSYARGIEEGEAVDVMLF